MGSESEAVFKELGEKHGWEDGVVSWMTSETGLNATSLSDFDYAVGKQGDIEKLVGSISPPPKNLFQQTARIRAAWLERRGL